jgi:hypothetical protein
VADAAADGEAVMETITAINELQNVKHEGESDYGYYEFDGYEVVTTEQRIRLLMTMETSCCETPGYFLSEDDPKDFIGAELRDVKIVDTELKVGSLKDNTDGYGVDDDGGVMFVNIETDRGVLQFVAYNRQNGYYGHTARVESRQLTHEERI